MTTIPYSSDLSPCAESVRFFPISTNAYFFPNRHACFVLFFPHSASSCAFGPLVRARGCRASPACARYRAEYAQDSYAQRDGRINSMNSSNGGGSIGGNLGLSGLDHSSSGHGHGQRPTTPTFPSFMTPAVSGTSQFSEIGSYVNGSSNHHPKAQSQPEVLAAQQQLEPPPPQMTPEETRAWDTACAAGLRDRGCRLVWVGASANAAGTGWGGGGGRGGSGSGEGGEGDGGGLSPPLIVADRVPWEYLATGLQHHLCGTLTIPSSRDRVVDEGPYESLSGEGSGGVGRDHDFGEGGGYGALDFQAPRGMNDEDMRYVRGLLQSKQAARRGSLPPGWGWGDESHGANNPDGGSVSGSHEADEDVITVDAFVQFSSWWAPLMTTLSRLRKDWATLSPIVIHGFVGRFEAERKLQGRERGTFLFRFSERKAGVLAVSFTETVRL